MAGLPVRVWDLSDGRLLRELPHEGKVTGGAFDRRGARVLTWEGNHDTGERRNGLPSAAYLWDLATQKPIQTIRHKKRVGGARFNATESHILTWTEDGLPFGDDEGVKYSQVGHPEAVKRFRLHGRFEEALLARDDTWVIGRGVSEVVVWSLAAGAEVRPIKPEGYLRGAVPSPDGRRLVTWSDPFGADKCLGQLWDLDTGKEVRRFEHPGSSIQGAAFCATTGRVLTRGGKFTDGAKGEARLWEVEKKEPVGVFLHDRFVNGAALNQTGTRALTWSWDGTAKLWALDEPNWDGRLLATFVHDGIVEAACFCRDEAFVLTRSQDGTVRRWAAPKTAPELRLDCSHAVADGVDSVSGRFVLWGLNGVWCFPGPDGRSPVYLRAHEKGIKGARLCEGGTRLATWSTGRPSELKVWEVGRPEPIAVRQLPGSLRGGVWSRNGTRLASWGDGKITVWAAADLTAVASLDLAPNRVTEVKECAFARDEVTLLAWGGLSGATAQSIHGYVRAWDVESGKSVWELDSPGEWTSAVFTRDHDRILTWPKLRLVSLSGQELKSQPPYSEGHVSTVLGQGGGRLLTGNTLRLGSPPNFRWSYWLEVRGADDLSLVRKIPFGDQSIVFGRLTRDGKQILAGFSAPKRPGDKWLQGENDGVKLWGDSGDDPLRTFKHPSVKGAVFDPMEWRVLSWGYDKTVRLWDVHRPDPLWEFALPTFVEGAAFLGGGGKVIAWTEKGSYLYDVNVSRVGTLEDQIDDVTLRSATRINVSGEVVKVGLAEWRRLMEPGSASSGVPPDQSRPTASTRSTQ
jgi:WD40 repeat protein